MSATLTFAIKFGLPVIPVIDRPDGVSKSLVFPGSVKLGFDAILRSNGIEFYSAPVGTTGEGLFVTLQRGQVESFAALMRQYLQPDNWNEIVGGRWLFIFSDGAKELDSVEADQEILARCKALYPQVSSNRTTMEMVNGLAFYRDVLFHSAYGAMIHSGGFSGTPGEIARQKVTEWLKTNGLGDFAVNYKLRDWLISRQRYWGAPIPMIFCQEHGWNPVPEDELPVLLPDDVAWKPTGESPLKLHPTWKNASALFAVNQLSARRIPWIHSCAHPGTIYATCLHGMTKLRSMKLNTTTGCRWIPIPAASSTPPCT